MQNGDHKSVVRNFIDISCKVFCWLIEYLHCTALQYITWHNIFPYQECSEHATRQWLSENKVTWVLNWYPVSERFDERWSPAHLLLLFLHLLHKSLHLLPLMLFQLSTSLHKKKTVYCNLWLVRLVQYSDDDDVEMSGKFLQVQISHTSISQQGSQPTTRAI